MLFELDLEFMYVYYIVLFVSIDILHASNQTTTKLRINLRKFNKHCNEQFYIMLSLITLCLGRER